MWPGMFSVKLWRSEMMIIKAESIYLPRNLEWCSENCKQQIELHSGGLMFFFLYFLIHQTRQ